LPRFQLPNYQITKLIDCALVLTAGLGTRLRPLTEVRAKPAVPVAGEPLIRRIVRWLAAHRVRDLVLNLHHRPETIAAVVGDGSDLAARVRYSWEQPDVLGSAGGPRQALPIVGSDTFFLINGDTLTDVDLDALGESHQSTGSLVTLALVPNPDPRRYGGVRLDRRHRVLGFVPSGVPAEDANHLTGVQVVDSSVFASLPAGRPARSIGGVYDALIAAQPGAIHGFVCDAVFWDVGTVADYWSTSWSFVQAEGRAAGSDGPADLTCGRRVRIHPEARVSRSILWDDVEISKGCIVDECVVTDGVRVPPGASHRRTILLRGPDGGVRTEPLFT
jgi:mannose-1-phosphate guanylyltransferase